MGAEGAGYPEIVPNGKTGSLAPRRGPPATFGSWDAHDRCPERAPAAAAGSALPPPAAALHRLLLPPTTHSAASLPAGTTWTAVGHIFCAVVGAGVLGLPNSVAWLGWVAGPICLVVFFAVSLWSSHLLAQLYCVDGIEFARYHHAVQHILVRGGRRAAQCVHVPARRHAVGVANGARCCRRAARAPSPSPFSSCSTSCCRTSVGACGKPLAAGSRLLGIAPAPDPPPPPPPPRSQPVTHAPSAPAAAYSITGAIAMQTVANLIGSSFSKEWQLVLVMGAFELVLSQVGGGAVALRGCCAAPERTCLQSLQVPSLEEIWWVSAIGTISSLGYVIIALILGLVYSVLRRRLACAAVCCPPLGRAGTCRTHCPRHPFPPSQAETIWAVWVDGRARHLPTKPLACSTRSATLPSHLALRRHGGGPGRMRGGWLQLAVAALTSDLNALSRIPAGTARDPGHAAPAATSSAHDASGGAHRRQWRVWFLLLHGRRLLLGTRQRRAWRGAAGL